MRGDGWVLGLSFQGMHPAARPVHIHHHPTQQTTSEHAQVVKSTPTKTAAETPKKMSAKGDLAAMMAARRKAQEPLNVPLPMAPGVTAQGSTSTAPR